MNTLRLLIIDDDEDDFLLTSDLLNQVAGQPVHATWAESYEAALGYIRRDDRDICLADYRLAPTMAELIKTAVALGCRAPMILDRQGDHSIDLLACRPGCRLPRQGRGRRRDARAIFALCAGAQSHHAGTYRSEGDRRTG